MCPHLHIHLHIQARLVVHACHQNTDVVEARISRSTSHHSEFNARVDYMKIQNKNINKKIEGQNKQPLDISHLYLLNINISKIYFLFPETFQHKLHT